MKQTGELHGLGAARDQRHHSGSAPIVCASVLLFLAVELAMFRPIGADAVMIDLGTLGGANSEALGVNNAGQVVGYARTAEGPEHAFLYSGQVMIDLGTLGGPGSVAFAINDLGQIVGCAEVSDGVSHAFVYSNGIMTDIGTLGGAYSCAQDINDAGQIVGHSLEANGYLHAFLYSNGIMTDLGTLGGPTSYAYAINDEGHIVGRSYAPINEAYLLRAFLYENGAMTDLGTLGREESEAYDINSSGQIVGWAATAPSGFAHPFLYSDGVMTDLGALTTRHSGATAINDVGQVVGWFEDVVKKDKTAFLYSDGTMTEMDTLGGLWTRAQDINDAGQIVGGSLTAAGDVHAFLTLAGRCGDGNIDAGEQCDDGNLVNGDGCNSECRIEGSSTTSTTTTTTTAPTATSTTTTTTLEPVEPVCGNTVLERGEECDDGNTVNGDGCSDLCELQQLCGDANDDGRHTASDAVLILKAAVGLDVICPTWICDVDGQNGPKASDALTVLSLSVGLPMTVQCGDITALVIRLADPVIVAGLNATIDLSNVAGSLTGMGSNVECESLVHGTTTLFNRTDVATLRLGYVRLEGIEGPTLLARCDFTAIRRVRSSDFQVTVEDAVDLSDEQIFPRPKIEAIPY